MKALNNCQNIAWFKKIFLENKFLECEYKALIILKLMTEAAIL